MSNQPTCPVWQNCNLKIQFRIFRAGLNSIFYNCLQYLLLLRLWTFPNDHRGLTDYTDKQINRRTVQIIDLIGLGANSVKITPLKSHIRVTLINKINTRDLEHKFCQSNAQPNLEHCASKYHTFTLTIEITSDTLRWL